MDPAAFRVAEDEADEPAPEVRQAAPADNAPPETVRPGAPTFPTVEAQVVDKQAAMAENPNLRETENEINAMDPLSAASQSYFALGSRVHLLNFKHAIDLFEAQHERFPTFEEFSEMMQTHQVEFAGLKPWQMYGYDSTEGTVCILEDLEVKRARYEAAGLEYEE